MLPFQPATSSSPRVRGSIGRRVLGVAGLLLASGCSPAGLLNGLAPERMAGEAIPYGPLPRHKLDLYQPSPETASPPMVVFLYGGGWTEGSRAMYRFVGAALAERGCIVAIPDYRLYPEAGFPAFLQDCALATRWAFDNRVMLGADPTRLFLMGHSAGAYNAAMLALDRQWLGAVAMQPARDLAGVIGIAGPYDFLPLRADLRPIFGAEEQLARTQPISFADGANPPMLLLQGEADETVDPGNARRLAERIRTGGGPVETRFYSGIGHAAIAGALSGALRFVAPTLRDSLTFMRVGEAQA
ncbi:alpha/beta hydrolase [Pseudoroseomonas wenyumeiae]|uniref:Alpha/beta hydrolase n=2 Tax=Teichococcus wenyumeiae TaxID=2478470 RepID=A0A3A9K3Y9_9PROT|nr:alpha/beta hydrolase [Pseudoroseomonas wenyumeiae]RMI19585.1 alpha/beta hydrolase [Pseudoroseomonas wenyumeiae]